MYIMRKVFKDDDNGIDYSDGGGDGDNNGIGDEKRNTINPTVNSHDNNESRIEWKRRKKKLPIREL